MNNESMILEFADGSSINVNTIIGGPISIDGITRDLLTIEIDPSSISLDTLKDIFNNNDNLAYLYTYEDNKDSNTRIEIGEGYTILVDISEVTRKVDKFPGKITADEFETIYSVSIAQMTYDEWISSKYSK